MSYDAAANLGTSPIEARRCAPRNPKMARQVQRQSASGARNPISARHCADSESRGLANPSERLGEQRSNVVEMRRHVIVVVHESVVVVAIFRAPLDDDAYDLQRRTSMVETAADLDTASRKSVRATQHEDA